MSVVATLEREHALIEQCLDLMLLAAAGLEQGKPVTDDCISPLLTFLREFADHGHHAKEEETLFPLLERRGIAKIGGPLGVMLYEHEQGRTMIRIMEGLRPELNIPGEARQRFFQVAKSYATLMREHINKENHCLFPMAQSVLTDADQQELATAFERLERDAKEHRGYAHFQELIAGVSVKLNTHQSQVERG